MGVVAMAQALRAYMRLKKSANLYMLQEENLNIMASAELKTPVSRQSYCLMTSSADR
eukprot:m.369335 g.369335  ORF g.369335 m.369335 type:complete len:57 (-) comp20849_c0_seq5:157-327(-)